MRILLCIDHFGPGGAQRQLVNLAIELGRRGHEVEFFIYHPGHDHFRAEVERAGAKVAEVTKRHRYSVRPVVALANHVRREKPDAVIAFLATPSLYAEVAGLVAGKVPVIVSERFMFTRMTAGLRLLQAFHRLAARITVNSLHQRARMVEHFPWMEPKLEVIYNGVDLEVFKPQAKREAVASPLRLLAVGNTAPKKNALGLARALHVLRSQGLPLPVVSWAGTPGSPADAEAKAAVDSFLALHDLQGQWNWLGRRDDVPLVLREHDALVHPAFYEGLPNAVCEALASGRPVLASDAGDHRHLVGDDRGFLFDPSDPADIARAVSDMASITAERYAAMAAAARRFAENSLSLERYGADYEQLLIDVVGARETSARSAGAT